MKVPGHNLFIFPISVLIISKDNNYSIGSVQSCIVDLGDPCAISYFYIPG